MSHVGIGPRGFATSLFGLVLESAGICRTFVVWSQNWGLCLKAPIRYLKVRARFSAHSAQVRGEVGLPTQLAKPDEAVHILQWLRDISVWACSRKRWYLQDFCGLESRLGFMKTGRYQPPPPQGHMTELSAKLAKS